MILIIYTSVYNQLNKLLSNLTKIPTFSLIGMEKNSYIIHKTGRMHLHYS